MREQMRFKDPQKIFQYYINEHIFSDNPDHYDYAGNYMYMGTISGKDQFKMIDTRHYIRIAESFESSLISEPLKINVNGGHHASANN